MSNQTTYSCFFCAFAFVFHEQLVDQITFNKLGKKNQGHRQITFYLLSLAKCLFFTSSSITNKLIVHLSKIKIIVAYPTRPDNKPYQAKFAMCLVYQLNSIKPRSIASPMKRERERGGE